MNIVEPRIETYMKHLTPKRNNTLTKMEDYAADKGFPIIGPLVGRFLQQLVILSGAQRIFELGSGFGYSALWMAQVLPDGGLIECSDLDADNIERGKQHFKEAGVAGKIKYHHGNALELLQQADGEFDLILNDVDKEYYPQALKIAWPKLRQGGVMVTDNSLWSGRIITEDPPADSTSGVIRFNEDAYSLPDAICTIVPIRDGLLLAVKR